MMGFFVVMIGLGAAWVLLVMPAFGLICLALSLLFRHLHKKHVQSAADGRAAKWRRVLSIVLALIGGLNLIAAAVGWIFLLIAGRVA